MGIFQILKNKVSRSIFWIWAIKKTEKIWHFCEFFHFYPTLDYHKIRTRTNFENPNGKNLDLHLIMWFTLKQLLPDSTDFTEAIFKMPQISKHFSDMLDQARASVWKVFPRPCVLRWGFVVPPPHMRGTAHWSGGRWTLCGGTHESEVFSKAFSVIEVLL